MPSPCHEASLEKHARPARVSWHAGYRILPSQRSTRASAGFRGGQDWAHEVCTGMRVATVCWVSAMRISAPAADARSSALAFEGCLPPSIFEGCTTVNWSFLTSKGLDAGLEFETAGVLLILSCCFP